MWLWLKNLGPRWYRVSWLIDVYSPKLNMLIMGSDPCPYDFICYTGIYPWIIGVMTMNIVIVIIEIAYDAYVCLCMPMYASVFITQQPSFIKWSFSVLKNPFLLWSWEFSCCWSSVSFHWNLYKGSRIIPTTGLMSIPQTEQFTWVHPSFDHVSMSK